MSREWHPIQPGQNPRDVFRRHRERGHKKFEYTYETLANLKGIKEQSVRVAVHDGRLDPENLLSVSRYLLKTAVPSEAPLTNEEFVKAIGEEEALNKWSARYPRFDMFVCGYPECGELLVGARLCAKHGPAKPMLILNKALYFEMLIGNDYIPLHRLVMGEPAGMDVHHKDHNRWNNHPANLEALPHAEHWKLHELRGQPKLVMMIDQKSFEPVQGSEPDRISVDA